MSAEPRADDVLAPAEVLDAFWGLTQQWVQLQEHMVRAMRGERIERVEFRTALWALHQETRHANRRLGLPGDPKGPLPGAGLPQWMEMRSK